MVPSQCSGTERPMSDLQIIRALSRTNQHQQQSDHKIHHHPSNQSLPSLSIDSKTKHAIKSITTHPTILPTNTTTKNGNLFHTKKSLRSNSISSIYSSQNQHHHPNTLPHTTHPNCSSTDSLISHTSNPLRSKLERKLSKLSSRFKNPLNSTNPRLNSPSQSNLIQNHSGPHQKLTHQPPRLQSSSSSSLSSLFEQAINRARHHHPNHKRQTESPQTLFTPSLSPSKPSPSPTPPPPPPLITANTTTESPPVVKNISPTQAHPHRIITAHPSSNEHGSPQENTPVAMRKTNTRNYDPIKRSPHTIYLPIEHSSKAIMPSPLNLQPFHKPNTMTSSHIKNNKLDKRQSPTQIALSRLDEILRGHRRNESTDLTPSDLHDPTDIYYGCQSINGHLINTHPFRPMDSSSTHSNHIPTHPTSTLSPILDFSPPLSLSPPLRARKKNQQKKAPSHHHSHSLNDHHANHILINPETWKSISISTSRYHHHPLRTLD